jgi:lantibiotic modifying enzyme
MTDGMPQMLGRAERAVRRFPPLMLGLDGKVPNNNVTLFFGLAGIGYELIRYTDPEFYEMVL